MTSLRPQSRRIRRAPAPQKPLLAALGDPVFIHGSRLPDAGTRHDLSTCAGNALEIDRIADEWISTSLATSLMSRRSPRYGIRDLPRLRRLYGKGYWRKMKGSARIRLRNGRIRLAELHWYEAHGIGKKELKRKRYLD